jgi:DNA repair exonuclease SbcCD ATPase subunit
MDAWLIILIVVAVAALTVGAFLLFRQRKEKARIESMSPEQRELYEAEKEYNIQVEQAEKVYQRTVKEWDKNVSTAEKELQKSIASGQKPLGYYKGVKLYENRVETPQGTAYFEKQTVSAMADTAGNIAMTQRVTLTRLVAGGIIGGLIFPKKKTHDSRELYLVVQTDSFGSVVECDPEHGPKVRQFAMSINNTAQNAAALKERREKAIADARQRLDSIKNEREKTLEQSKQELQATKSDSSRLEEARRRAGL